MLQKFEYGTEFILLGIENQQEIHYAMPLRAMMYDGEGYIAKESRLHPIITLVIYYGKEPWIGPLSLEDMLIPIPDVKTVMDLSRAVLLGDKQLLTETYHDKKVSKDLVSVVGSITKSRKIMELATKEECEEEVNMCVIEDWIEESREIGRSEGWLDCESKLVLKMFQNGIEIEQIEDISRLLKEKLLS